MLCSTTTIILLYTHNSFYLKKQIFIYFTSVSFSYFLIVSWTARLTKLSIDFDPSEAISSLARLLPLANYGVLLKYSSGRLCSSFCGSRDSFSDAENNGGKYCE